jgi:hypothetical protein
VFGSFQRVKELEQALESAIDGMENSCAQLKKLAPYVTADIFVDEIVWWMLEVCLITPLRIGNKSKRSKDNKMLSQKSEKG